VRGRPAGPRLRRRVTAAVLAALAGAGSARGQLAARSGALFGTPPSGPFTVPLVGDSTIGLSLTLDDAEQIARHNNPTFLEILVARRSASAALRAAYGGLLPQLTASFSAQYQQSGTELVSDVSFGLPSDALASYYQLGVSYQLNAATLFTPAFARANRDAAEADIGSQGNALRNAVAQQYLVALQDQAQAALQDTLIADAQVQLDLARAREVVGSGTPLDTRRAEVAVSQQRVNALQANTQAAIDILRLFQQLGVPEPAGVRLTTTFEVTAPHFTLDSILTLARAENPDLVALRARAHAANVGVHRARGLYAPTLTINTGVGGYTYQYTNSDAVVVQAQQSAQESYALCAALDTAARAASGYPTGCSGILLTPGQLNQVRASNRQFPFNFTTNPYQVTATLSLPLFDGFVREQQVEQASAAEDDARYTVRARELQLTADVTSGYFTLTTALQTAQLQQDNAAKAREDMLFAEERYRVGTASFLDVADARAAYERAEADRIGAVYNYHKAFAALENAIGRPLR
jgi:outer membrane protein